MQIPIGSGGWYVCDDEDEPDGDFVDFQGHDATAIQFLNQFRDDALAQRAFKALIGATHPFYDEDTLSQALAVRLDRGTLRLRQPTFTLYPSSG